MEDYGVRNDIRILVIVVMLNLGVGAGVGDIGVWDSYSLERHGEMEIYGNYQSNICVKSKHAASFYSVCA